MDNFIYIADDFFFLCIGLLLLYLFILAVASHFKHSNYPKARKQYQCAILVQDGSLLPFMYQQEAYEFITYKDLLEAINSLDKERYELVILLSDKASALSPHFWKRFIMPTMPEYRQCSCTRSLIIVREYGNVSMLYPKKSITVFSDRGILRSAFLQVFSEPIWLST